MKVSMDGKGRALDNVFVERLWRTVKYEDIYLKDYRSPRDATRGLREYFHFYNHLRPHQSLGGKTPAAVYQEKTLMGKNKQLGEGWGDTFPHTPFEHNVYY